MSKVSDCFDALAAKLVTIFPSHYKQTQRYKTDENSESTLEASYGLQFGPAEKTDSQFESVAMRRSFIVTLTRRVRANEFDVDSKIDADKLLMEDVQLLINAVEIDPTLGNSVAVSQASWLSDSGVEFVFGDKDNFLKTDVVISVEYMNSFC